MNNTNGGIKEIANEKELQVELAELEVLKAKYFEELSACKEELYKYERMRDEALKAIDDAAKMLEKKERCICETISDEYLKMCEEFEEQKILAKRLVDEFPADKVRAVCDKIEELEKLIVGIKKRINKGKDLLCRQK